MPVERYRSVEDMPPAWRDADDPANLRQVALMMTVYRRFAALPAPGVRRFRSIEEANAEGHDPLRGGRATND